MATECGRIDFMFLGPLPNSLLDPLLILNPEISTQEADQSDHFGGGSSDSLNSLTLPHGPNFS